MQDTLINFLRTMDYQVETRQLTAEPFIVVMKNNDIIGVILADMSVEMIASKEESYGKPLRDLVEYFKSFEQFDFNAEGETLIAQYLKSTMTVKLDVENGNRVYTIYAPDKNGEVKPIIYRDEQLANASFVLLSGMLTKDNVSITGKEKSEKQKSKLIDRAINTLVSIKNKQATN